MNVLSYAATAGLTALVLYLLVVGKPILLPLVIAVFVWYLINALALQFERVRVYDRQLPASLRFTAAILVLLGLLWFVANLVAGNINQVAAAAPGYEQNLRQLMERASVWLRLDEVPTMEALLEGVSVADLIRGLAAAVTGIIGNAGTVLIYVAFLLLEQSSFNKKIAALFTDPGREALVHRIIERIATEIQTYVWLKTLTSLLTGFLSYLVMKMVGVDFAEFWALLIFALNYIPYIGALLGVVFPTLLTLVQFDTLTPFFIVAGTLTLIQFTIGNVLEPRIMGKGLNISPLIMLLSLAVWGSIWGVVGMFLAVPLMVVVMIICANFEATRPVAIILSEDGQLHS